MNDSKRFAIRAEAIHGDRFDYSEVRFWSRSTPVEIICKKHGKFRVSPKRHLARKCGGCPRCNRMYYQANRDSMVDESNIPPNSGGTRY
jgi:hypothetical protein